MSRVTATEASRTFSEILNRVAAGEEIEITRSGAAVAVIAPPKTRLVTADHFRALMATAPRVDPGFAGDLRELREAAGPPRESWPS